MPRIGFPAGQYARRNNRVRSCCSKIGDGEKPFRQDNQYSLAVGRTRRKHEPPTLK